MDPHELAIAALNEVAQSACHRDISMGTIASPSSPNASGNYIKFPMANNTIVDGVAGAQPPCLSTEKEGNIVQIEGGQEYQNLGGVGPEAISSNNSQSSNIDSHDVFTPLTSASDGFSSQSTNQDGPLSQLSQLAAATQPIGKTARPNLAAAPTAGHKRTADGHVKPSAFQSPTTPYVRGHLRNTSAVSNISNGSSRIGELSSELRTRLSYAMVKVNNGWQSNSIDEVESLASQKGSPTSSSSTLHGRRSLLTSPRTAIASIQGQTSNISAVTQTPMGDFDLYSRTDPASRTYESFWRDHSTTVNAPTHNQPSHTEISSLTPSKSLGPPADIRATSNSRRSGAQKFSKPPSMSRNGSNPSFHNTSAPRTPCRGDFRDGAAIQTPTQKTIQEQDAIETLLFMSSPGNSGNMGHAFPPPRNQGSPQQSPLRAEFNVLRGAQEGRRVSLEETGASESTGSRETSAEYRRNKMGSKSLEIVRGRSDAIDRMLDEMDSSSDEEELGRNYTSPRRVEAGRV